MLNMINLEKKLILCDNIINMTERKESSNHFSRDKSRNNACRNIKYFRNRNKNYFSNRNISSNINGSLFRENRNKESTKYCRCGGNHIKIYCEKTQYFCEFVK